MPCLINTADCTGHGIPGGFLSMLGISALKEFCATEYDAANPGTILDRMRDFVKTTLVSDDSEIDDGMDMTICSYDFDSM
ncbi:MAG: SpoIIE family protein phosphatase, partial [Bacteroidales bacterium]|nr:SpoIIE family protein phosphatase [Bacteroidales bacterium]